MTATPPATDRSPLLLYKVHVDPAVNKGLQQYLRDRFCQLNGEYRTLMFPCDDPAARAMAEAILEKAKTCLTFDDVYNFEKALLKLWSLPELRRRAWEIRALFRDIAGPSQFDLYLKTNPPDPDKAEEIDLRSDLMQLQNELHRLLIILPARSMVRNGIVASQMRGLAWLFGILMVLAASQPVLYWTMMHLKNNSADTEFFLSIRTLSVLSLVAFCGAIGGAMSTLRRLQSTSSEGNPLLVLYGLIFGRTSIVLAPVSGAIFALVLYMLFAANVISGVAFPHIGVYNKDGVRIDRNDASPQKSRSADPSASPAGPGSAANTAGFSPAVESEAPGSRHITMADFLFKSAPMGLTDYAALLIWSFLAGFAEQLVPDTLNRLKTKAQASENTKEVKTQNA